MIGDMAEIFGCVLEIPDLVTGISFVALGTSMPDLFASRHAAVEERQTCLPNAETFASTSARLSYIIRLYRLLVWSPGRARTPPRMLPSST